MFSLFELKSEWRQVDTTCDPCKVCKEVIYGKQYQQFINGQPTEQIVCDPCFQEIDKPDTRE